MMKPRIADLERALDHRNGWTAVETQSVDALLRLARAAQGVECDAHINPIDWCEKCRLVVACNAFDWGDE